jgi:glycosyltransferase involved in cell wall biosynthesis
MPSIKADRFVATHHDCTIERFPHLFREAKIVMGQKRKMLKKADLVFSVSTSSRNDLLEFYDFDASKIVVLTHPPAPVPRSEEAAVELKNLVARPFLLYVGTRVPYKNFGGLIRGFSASGLQKDFDLLVIGGGPFSEAERSEVVSLGLGDAVISVPLASAGLLGEAYAAASAFIYPSLYEGLGLPPLEAMEKGCPVLVSSNPACVEVCKDGALFFDPFNQDDLIDKLRLIVQDTEENRARVQRGYQVRDIYSWDLVIEKMMVAYKSIS